MRVDTGGSVELCPACPCATDYAEAQFSILDTVDAELIEKYGTFLAANRIEVGAIEFIVDAEGRAYTYDVNTNTNYNTDAERRAKRDGMQVLARYLGSELRRLQSVAA